MHHRKMRETRDLTASEHAFLEQARTAVLATVAPDGLPRLVPICFAVAGSKSGSAVVLSPLDEKPKRVVDPHDLERVRDIRTNPTVSLLVERWSEDWSQLAWLRLAGRAELIEPDGLDAAEHAAAVAALRAKYPQYEQHRLEDRPIIRIVVTGARSWGAIG
jgi:PPOX class probable F420-dependent enzyme